MEALHTGAIRTMLVEATLLLTAALVSAFKPQKEGTDTAAAARDAIAVVRLRRTEKSSECRRERLRRCNKQGRKEYEANPSGGCVTVDSSF